MPPSPPPSPLLRLAFSLEGTLRCVIRTYCRNPSDIEEVLQETYARIHIAGNGPGTILNQRGWILRVARNAAIDHYRRLASKPLEFHEDLELLEQKPTAFSAYEILSGQQELALLVEVIELLPPRRREVLWRREVLGESRQEIADALHITVETVAVHLRKAWIDLAEHLGQLGEARVGTLLERLHKLRDQG